MTRKYLLSGGVAMLIASVAAVLWLRSGPDPSDFAYLTAVIEVNGEPEAWFTLRASGKLLKLRRQQSFDIGSFHGVVADISGSDVTLLCDDERWLLTVGENLMQASTLPPEF